MFRPTSASFQKLSSGALFTQLSGALGAQQANAELRWMKEKSSTQSALSDMVQRRLQGEPLQYILGTQPFGPLDILVRPPVLIPRPETEDWTLRLAKKISPTQTKPIKLLDLCTGTACIPLLLCHLWPDRSVQALGVDISALAAQLASENAKKFGFVPSEAQTQNSLSVLNADILEDGFISSLIKQGWPPFDVLTANPPYISRTEYDRLPPSVKNYEDIRALLGDRISKNSAGNGLDFYRAIADLVGKDIAGDEYGLVKPGGLIVLEVGHNQSRDVEMLMIERGHVRRTEIWKDPWGIERVVLSWK